MTLKQKCIIAVLAIADLAIIVGLVALMTRLARITALSTPAPHAGVSTSGAPANLSSEACQWQAAQRMLQTGLGGTVALTAGGALRFEIVTALAPGQTAADAAQLVWTAFDVALALEDECAFTQVEVTIRIQDRQPTTTLHASVSAADLAAYGAGTLTEDELINRVTYTIDNQ